MKTLIVLKESDRAHSALLTEISRLERVGIQVPESVGVLAKRTAEEHAALLSDRAALVEALREIAAMYPPGVVGHQASDKARAALNAAAEPARPSRRAL